MVAQNVSSFSCVRFPKKTRRKWTKKTVNVIVKRQTNKRVDNNVPSMFDKSADDRKLLLKMEICKRKLRKADP